MQNFRNKNKYSRYLSEMRNTSSSRDFIINNQRYLKKKLAMKFREEKFSVFGDFYSKQTFNIYFGVKIFV